MLLRISAIIVLLLSVLFMPFWLSVILGLAGMIYFNKFFEAPVLFMLSDSLYGIKEAKFSGMVFVSFFVCLIILVVMEILKKNSNFKFKQE
jgi:hypothetical protein